MLFDDLDLSNFNDNSIDPFDHHMTYFEELVDYCKTMNQPIKQQWINNAISVIRYLYTRDLFDYNIDMSFKDEIVFSWNFHGKTVVLVVNDKYFLYSSGVISKTIDNFQILDSFIPEPQIFNIEEIA